MKSVAQKLLVAYPDKYSADFEANKRSLDTMGITDEKFTRNKIAGYIVRLVRQKKVAA